MLCTLPEYRRERRGAVRQGTVWNRKGWATWTTTCILTRRRSSETVAIQRREKFRDTEIFLPKVLHRDTDGGWEELDYQRHIVPGIDLDVIGPPDPQSAHADRPRESTATVDLDDGGASAIYYDPQALHVDESVKIAWYARRISDILPNPFQAARIAQELVAADV